MENASEAIAEESHITLPPNSEAAKACDGLGVHRPKYTLDDASFHVTHYDRIECTVSDTDFLLTFEEGGIIIMPLNGSTLLSAHIEFAKKIIELLEWEGEILRISYLRAAGIRPSRAADREVAE